MSQLIINITKDVLKNGLINLSKKEACKPSEVQLMIIPRKDADGDIVPSYYLYKNWQPIREITFNEILNVKIDFTMKEQFVKPFLSDALPRLSEKNNIEIEKLGIAIMTHDETITYDDKDKPYFCTIYIMNGSKFVKTILVEKDILLMEEA